MPSELRPRASDVVTPAIFAVALAILGYDAVAARHAFYYGVDFQAVYDGAQALRAHGDPYLAAGFVYPPIAAVLLLPVTVLGDHVGAVGLVVTLAAMLVVALSTGSLLERRASGRLSALTLLVLALSPNAWLALATGNFQTLVSAAALASLLLLFRGRPLAGAVMLGLAIGLKPAVVPFLLVLLLRREWRLLVTACVVAAGANLLAAVALRHPADFLTRVLPDVLHGATVTPADNLSIWAVGQRTAGLQWTLVPVDLLVLAVAVVAIWFTRRCDRPWEALVAATSATLAAFLLTRVDEPFYGLVAVPALVSCVVGDRGMLARALGSVALVGCCVFGSPYTSYLGPHSALIGTLGQVLALVTLAVAARQEALEPSRRAMVSR